MFKNGKSLLSISSLGGKETVKLMKKFRSSCPEVFCKKGVFKNFTKFTGKHLCWSLILTDLATRLRCFHLNFVKFLRTAIV